MFFLYHYICSIVVAIHRMYIGILHCLLLSMPQYCNCITLLLLYHYNYTVLSELCIYTDNGLQSVCWIVVGLFRGRNLSRIIIILENRFFAGKNFVNCSKITFHGEKNFRNCFEIDIRNLFATLL